MLTKYSLLLEERHLEWSANCSFHLASLNKDNFAIFHQDKLANNWRSATFQCIHAAVTASDENMSVSNSPLAKLKVDNVKRTRDRIMGVLTEVSR